MAAERDLLVSVLKLTRDGPVQRGLVSRDARVPTQVADELLGRLSRAGLVQWEGKAVGASPHQRVRIAVRAIRLGADLEKVCRFLRWNEFENIAAGAFEANSFTVLKHFRFGWAGRRWEIDILGCKEPMVACVDCKHWRRGWRRSAIIRAVESQVERTRALGEALPSLRKEVGLADWKRATLVPVVLSLVPGPFKFYNMVPIVPVLQLQSFLSELPAHAASLTRFLASF
jgi:Holliday junction resolvase-like predicted endonuclease